MGGPHGVVETLSKDIEPARPARDIRCGVEQTTDGGPGAPCRAIIRGRPGPDGIVIAADNDIKLFRPLGNCPRSGCHISTYRRPSTPRDPVGAGSIDRVIEAFRKDIK